MTDRRESRRKPLVVARPTKPWSEMTEEEADAFADEFAEAMFQKLRAESPPE